MSCLACERATGTSGILVLSASFPSAMNWLTFLQWNAALALICTPFSSDFNLLRLIWNNAFAALSAWCLSTSRCNNPTFDFFI